jgi:hypothetical protein
MLPPRVIFRLSVTEAGAQLAGSQAQVVAKLHAVAVDVVLEVVVTEAAEQLGAATQRVFVGQGQTFRVDIAIPDHVAHVHPWLQHLAADDVQVLDLVRVVVDVAKVQPDRLLVEVVVLVLVGGARVVAAAGGDADTGVDLRVDLGVGTQAGTDALTVLVAATVVGFALDLHGFLTETHVTLELGLGGPGQFLVEDAQFVGFFAVAAICSLVSC